MNAQPIPMRDAPTRNRPQGPLPGLSPEEDLDAAAVVRVLGRHKGVIAGVIIPIMLLAAGVLWQLTPRYTAETLILLEAEGPNLGQLDAVIGGLPRDVQTIQSEAYVLMSRSLADRVIQRLSLAADPEFNPRLAEEQGARPVGSRPAMPGADATAADALVGEDLDTAQAYSKIVDRFLQRLAVAPQENSRVIAVNFSSVDAEKAARVANVVADEYITSRLEAKFESTRRASEWLNDRVAELREKVTAAEQAVEDARRKFGLLRGQGGITLATQELVELNTQLVMARTARAEAEARLEQVSSLSEDGDGLSTASSVLDSPLIQRLREQEAAVQRRVAELSSQLGERHPRMVQLRAEAADLRNKIDEEVNKVVAGLRNEVKIAKAREAALQQNLAALKERAAIGNKNEIELRALEREAEANRALLANLLARQKEAVAQEDEGFQRADARVISVADIPTQPSFPRKGITLGLVFIVACFVALMVVLLLEVLDDGFRSGEQLERLTGLPSLGFVPKIRNLSGAKNPARFVLAHPRSAFGESIRTLNWSISLAEPDSPPQVVLITSSRPGEGKTVIATSLALNQSTAGRRVLLIDADTRRPETHNLLSIRRTPGLVDYLVGEATLDELLTVPEETSLTVIPAGVMTPNSPNLLGAQRMVEMLNDLRKRFDLIIIDSPPVMAGSDTRLLCRQADATVMVVRWAETRRGAVRVAVGQLLSAGAQLSGLLLSMVDARRHAKYGYGDSGAYAGELEKYYVG